MQYPLISEYIESVLDADNFATLTNLRPVLDNNGNPVMSSGNFAVVFKMTDGEKNYAVKCFTREQEGRDENYRLICEELNKIDSPYILKIKYLEKEIFVDTNQSDETEFPVLAMDWVEGKTLSAFLSDIAKEYDINHETWNEYKTKFNLFELRCMPTNFLWMTKWLLTQPFAHGDLKPDNIVVQENGTCVLIDYDGMFVPSMQGMSIACGGTQNFRHPYNQNQNLCKAVDNYAIAIIALSLQAFAIRPDLISKSSEFCIVSETDVLTNNYSERLLENKELSSDKSFQSVLSVFFHVLSCNTLSSEWFNATIGGILEPPDYDIYDTDRNDYWWDDNCWHDKYGMCYSWDGKKFLGHDSLKEKEYEERTGNYHIREGVLTICDKSIPYHCRSIIAPASIHAIGDFAFENCEGLKCINISSSVKYISDKNPWKGCFNIENMPIQSPNFTLKDGILYSSDFKVAHAMIYWHSNIRIDIRTREISSFAFWSGEKYCEGDYYGCYEYEIKPEHPIKQIALENVEKIGEYTFHNCSSAIFSQNGSIGQIGEGAFMGCKQLKSIDIKDVLEIPARVFSECDALQAVFVDQVYHIDSAFNSCHSLKIFKVPQKTSYISEGAFDGCISLETIDVDEHNCVYASIDGVLFNKEKTTLIKYPRGKTSKCYEIPLTVNRILSYAFYDNEFIEHIISKNDITPFFEGGVFSGCSIDSKAFEYCHSLKTFKVPQRTSYISEDAFRECISLEAFDVDEHNCVYASMDGVLFNKEKTTLIKYPRGKTSKCYEIPLTVNRILSHAFCDNEFIEHIISKNDITPFFEGNVFSGCSSIETCEIKLSQNVNKESLYNLGRSLPMSEALPYLKKAVEMGCVDALKFLSWRYDGDWEDNEQFIYWAKYAANYFWSETGKYYRYWLEYEKKHPNEAKNKNSWIKKARASLTRIEKRTVLSQIKETHSKTPLRFSVNGESFEMIPVEGGEFVWWYSFEVRECRTEWYDVHEIIKNFAIGKVVVTQALWETVMNHNPSTFKGENLPVENVSFDECKDFIERLNLLTGQKFRLLSKNEWYYAAMGGNKRIGNRYSGSDDINEVAWYAKNSGGKTHPVGTKMANELGVYDMCGNVYEWTETCQEGYCPSVGKLGGDWNENSGACRIPYYDEERTSINTEGIGYVKTYTSIGLRLALSLE